MYRILNKIKNKTISLLGGYNKKYVNHLKKEINKLPITTLYKVNAFSCKGAVIKEVPFKEIANCESNSAPGFKAGKNLVSGISGSGANFMIHDLLTITVNPILYIGHVESTFNYHLYDLHNIITENDVYFSNQNINLSTYDSKFKSIDLIIMKRLIETAMQKRYTVVIGDLKEFNKEIKELINSIVENFIPYDKDQELIVFVKNYDLIENLTKEFDRVYLLNQEEKHYKNTEMFNYYPEISNEEFKYQCTVLDKVDILEEERLFSP